MGYRGCVGDFRYNNVDGLFHGKLLGVRDLITYEGPNIVGLERAFHEAVDNYLATLNTLAQGADHGRVHSATLSEDKPSGAAAPIVRDAAGNNSCS